MGVSPRAASLFAALAVAATATAVSAVAPAPASRALPPGGKLIAQASPSATPPSCIPVQTTGSLPTPTPIDAWTQPSSGPYRHYFTIDISQTTDSGGNAFYCYTRPGQTSYVEAPSIRVRVGDTFTMQLVDRIPPPLQGTTPSPAPQATTPDGCALLDYEGPVPPPNDTPGYFNHPRVSATPAHAMMPNDTNLHTHGWHVSPDVDNVFKSMAMTANGICTFTFTIESTQPPGTYWYHAHLHGISDQQVGGGLAGALIVLPASGAEPLPDTTLVIKTYTAPAGGSSNAMMLRKYKRLAALQPKRRPVAKRLGAAPIDPFSPPPWVSGMPINQDGSGKNYPYCPDTMSSGGALQVNGQPIPEFVPGTPPAVRVQRIEQAANSSRRYRIINAAADTYVNVRMLRGGAYEQLKVLARDGVPVNWGTPPGSTAPFVVRDNVMLGPSNRVDILVQTRSGDPVRTIIGEAAYGATPTPSPQTNHFPFCLGYNGSAMYRRNILAIGTAGAALAAAPGARVTARELTQTPAFRFGRNVPSANARVITFTEYPYTSVGYFQGNFYVTETGSAPAPLPGPFQEQPFWLSAPPTPGPQPPISFHYLPAISVNKATTQSEIWTLVNATAEAHTFHIHQMTFVALQSPWEPTGSESVFLDSIALPAAAIVDASKCAGATPSNPCLQPSITRIKINYGPIHRGTFVYHCHMLFHEDAGMMGIIRVY